jgi:hypothetical protein
MQYMQDTSKPQMVGAQGLSGPRDAAADAAEARAAAEAARGRPETGGQATAPQPSSSGVNLAAEAKRDTLAGGAVVVDATQVDGSLGAAVVRAHTGFRHRLSVAQERLCGQPARV